MGPLPVTSLAFMSGKFKEPLAVNCSDVANNAAVKAAAPPRATHRRGGTNKFIVLPMRGKQAGKIHAHHRLNDEQMRG